MDVCHLSTGVTWKLIRPFFLRLTSDLAAISAILNLASNSSSAPLLQPYSDPSSSLAWKTVMAPDQPLLSLLYS